MAGTETGLKYLQRKIKALARPDSDEGKITQTDAYQSPAAIKRNRLLDMGLDGEEVKKASLDKRMNMQQEEVEGKKAGGTVKSASSRADGCCVKGKTRGKMV